MTRRVLPWRAFAVGGEKWVVPNGIKKSQGIRPKRFIDNLS
jgi:hypothetical protein